MSYLHLGQSSAYAEHYDPCLLQAIPRATQRQHLHLGAGPLPFIGADFWTGYELSWLNPKGKPQVALLQLTIPCESPNLIESKSLKLYLNSFNHSVYTDAEHLRRTLAHDLSAAAFGPSPAATPQVGVRIVLPEDFATLRLQELAGTSLDRLDIECQHYTPEPDLLHADFDSAPVSETLCSQLLKSNCLVTGQPDWGSLQISYSGPQIDQAGLLAYIISFRQHQEFHEHCVERIFLDLWRRCRPSKLSVYARYTRRGGLDINPWRSSHPMRQPELHRSARQ